MSDVGGENQDGITLPPHTTCAKCGREIESDTATDTRDRYRYRVIAVRDLLTDTTSYYHHPCYNQTY